jgi:hypothetical protein
MTDTTCPHCGAEVHQNTITDDGYPEWFLERVGIQTKRGGKYLVQM